MRIAATLIKLLAQNKRQINAPHVPTLLLIIVITSATLAIAVGWVARLDDQDGLKKWTGALILHTLVFALFSLRDKVPDFLSILLANIALSCTYALLLAAIGQFQQRRIAPALLWGPPLLTACFFALSLSNISARIIGGGLIFAGQILSVLFALTNRQYPIHGRGKHLMIGGFIMMIGVIFIRILGEALSAEGTQSIVRTTPIQILTFLSAFVTLILTSNGFVLMTKERADERSHLLARKDRLTGVWNRIQLEEATQQEMSRLERYGHPVALIMMDLDHFKRINDQFGHATGDMILKGFCDIVHSCIRSTDVLGRWGGEEFVLVMPNSGFASAAQLAERIRSALEQHEFPGGHKITASFGFAVCQSTDTCESWLHRADMALYRAKTAGRNRVEAECLESQAGQVEPDAVFIKLAWSQAYECGHSKIDSQHHALFDHANILLRAILSHAPKPEIMQQVNTLIAEIRQHFADEGAELRTIAYPDVQHHYELHYQLQERAAQLAERFEKDQLGEGELLHFLAYEVIAQHMLIEDRKYFPLFAG